MRRRPSQARRPPAPRSASNGDARPLPSPSTPIPSSLARTHLPIVAAERGHVRGGDQQQAALSHRLHRRVQQLGGRAVGIQVHGLVGARGLVRGGVVCVWVGVGGWVGGLVGGQLPVSLQAFLPESLGLWLASRCQETGASVRRPAAEASAAPAAACPTPHLQRDEPRVANAGLHLLRRHAAVPGKVLAHGGHNVGVQVVGHHLLDSGGGQGPRCAMA